MCNMAIECGAKAGIMDADAVTFEYMAGPRTVTFGRYPMTTAPRFAVC